MWNVNVAVVGVLAFGAMRFVVNVFASTLKTFSGPGVKVFPDQLPFPSASPTKKLFVVGVVFALVSGSATGVPSTSSWSPEMS